MNHMIPPKQFEVEHLTEALKACGVNVIAIQPTMYHDNQFNSVMIYTSFRQFSEISKKMKELGIEQLSETKLDDYQNKPVIYEDD